MPFKKYEIHFLKESRGTCSYNKLSIPFLLVFFVCMVALLAGNVFLFNRYMQCRNIEYRQDQSVRVMNEQRFRLLALTQQARQLGGELERVLSFNQKLRWMTSNEAVEQTAGMGGSTLNGADKQYFNPYNMKRTVNRLHESLRQMATAAILEEVRQQKLLSGIQSMRERLETTPAIWPVRGTVTSGFGWRKSPFTGKSEIHKGLDIANPRGTPIYAPAKGLVSFVGFKNAYGRVIVIEHGNSISTRYAHLSSSVVEVGQKVIRGELIGNIGMTGRTSGPHVHYEVRIDDKPVNPKRYILD